MPINMPITSINEQIRALPPDTLYEIVDGEVIVAEPMGALGTIIAAMLTYFLNRFALSSGHGIALIEGLYCFDENLPQRRPDVSFIPAAQWPANLRPDADPRSLQTVPTLAVEVISPSSLAAEIEDKRLEYFEAGVKAVWIVHPIPRTIHVYSSPDDCHVISADGVLDGGAAIPGFQVKMADVFACVFPAEAQGVNENA
jgi:Uma2 family endonuclease